MIPERYSKNAPDGVSDDDAFTIALAGIDDAGRITFVNHTLLRLWGFADDRQLGGMPIAQLWEDTDALTAIMPSLARMPQWSGTLTARLADGRLKRLMVFAEPMLHGSETMTGYTLACIDTRSLSLQQHASYRILAMADVAVIAVTDVGTIIEANRRTGEIFGYRMQEIIGRSIHDLVPSEFRKQHVDQLRGFLEGSETERRMGIRSDVAGVRKDGSRFPAEVSISRFKSGEEWILVATLRDITDRKMVENELLWRASHDSLTGLPNRTMIHERLTRALQRSTIQGHSVALLFVDLDGFKLVNDSYGHATGDELLKDVAKRLLEQVRPGDTVGRLGGDEFVILCDQVDSPSDITVLAERIIGMLRAPFELQSHRLLMAASIGLAMGNGITHSADDLLRDADAAMYNAKEQGRDGWRFFYNEINTQVLQRHDIAKGLRLALTREEFQAFFQPILDTQNRQIRGAELLLRWHPPTGEIAPADFIPIAEMTGSIIAIGRWVFRQACLAQAAWMARHGDQAPYVSVNISARQLNDETLVDSCKADLADTGADPARVLLELTETSLMSDVAVSLRILNQLAELGLRVAVDDFGTGYSSLSQLLRIPVRTLKIDREFISGIDSSHDSKAIVSAVSSMARAMKLEVVAEGVENECQLAYLRDIGCDCVQGFLLHRPMPAEDFLQLLDKQATNPPSEMQGRLYTILYVSLATHPMNQDELSQLLKHSRTYNREWGITGFLLYLNGSFMQMLEGQQPQIQSLVERIERDPRHHSIRTVYQGQISTRVFADWSMGFRDMEHIDQGYDFQAWQGRTLNFLDMSEDARICYSLIAAFAR